ncbi:hypothetical protein FHS85_001697 [Rhodoligotrophos appendicifer]|uniref:hypothetical protein n=1 Tax=Rhodoligotrophos appendicifer TaxID=987056 RepID=UPI00118482E9|nr:hypothetical protein [Rhodoligotrophos appendicifer]
MFGQNQKGHSYFTAEYKEVPFQSTDVVVHEMLHAMGSPGISSLSRFQDPNLKIGWRAFLVGGETVLGTNVIHHEAAAPHMARIGYANPRMAADGLPAILEPTLDVNNCPRADQENLHLIRGVAAGTFPVLEEWGGPFTNLTLPPETWM